MVWESCYAVLVPLWLLVMRPLTEGKRRMRNAEPKQNENNLKQERRTKEMKTIKFHDYASTYNLQDFLDYCKDEGYKVTASMSYICKEGYRITHFQTDENTARHLHCYFPHNVTMGDSIE